MSESPFVLLSSPLMHEMGEQIRTHFEKEKGVVLPHYELEFTIFANGEPMPRIPHTIRGQHVFFLHALQHPDPCAAVMMMLIANDAIKRASASGITLVVPYMSFLRQDRKDKPRVPITARLIADLIESNHAVRTLITIDMHAEQEQGFFSIPVDNLPGSKIFADYLQKRFGADLSEFMMLAPDFGGSVRNNRLGEALGGLSVGIVEKRRTGPNSSKIMRIMGDVAGKYVVIHEDMICTGGTALKVQQAAIEGGAKGALLCATHAIFSQGEDQFRKHGSVICTDSIPRSPQYYVDNPWLTKVSIASYLADAMYEATQVGGSISKLSQ